MTDDLLMTVLYMHTYLRQCPPLRITICPPSDAKSTMAVSPSDTSPGAKSFLQSISDYVDSTMSSSFG
jgi:hypothetical protein